MIRKSYAALRNLVTSLPNPNPDPNLNLSGQVKSESTKKRLGSASLIGGGGRGYEKENVEKGGKLE